MGSSRCQERGCGFGESGGTCFQGYEASKIHKSHFSVSSYNFLRFRKSSPRSSVSSAVKINSTAEETEERGGRYGYCRAVYLSVLVPMTLYWPAAPLSL